MPTDLILTDRPTNKEIGSIAETADRASEFIQQSKAANTVRAYKADWADFERWCKTYGQLLLPATPETVALYVTHLSATHKTATITRRISAISQAHQIAGLESPTKSSQVRLLMAGIRRSKGTAQAGKSPVLVEDLRQMLKQLPDNLLGVRDRALLLIGFAGAFRRSAASPCRYAIS
jgi:site-specific recombinase XerD